jgi:hypothetical protein
MSPSGPRQPPPPFRPAPPPGLAPSPQAVGREIMPSPWFPTLDLRIFKDFLDEAPQADGAPRAPGAD